MNITTTITIPSAPAYFEGHFPGNPILPGVAEIALAQAALADEIPSGLSLQAINFMRFRQLVLPGDCLELSAKTAENGCLRVELKRKGTLVANGEWGLGRLDEHKKASPLAGIKASPLSEMPSLNELLPHRSPMRFLDAILSETTESLTCTATIPAACPLVDNDSVPAVVGLEAAAQAAAAWGALQRPRTTDAVAPRVGYLVALREILFFSEAIPAETRLHIEIKLEAAAPPLSHYRVVLSQEGKLLAQGLIVTYLKEGDE